MINACEYTTPVGTLSVLATDIDSDREGAGTVVAAGFCSPQELWDRLPSDDRAAMHSVPDLGPIEAPIQAFLAGDVHALDNVAVRQAGTALQQQVWSGLRDIPAGQTRTYGELAEASGSPKAVRAVGSACGKNLIAPFVPCHRALRSDGSLGGYHYGLDVKRWLLAREQAADRSTCGAGAA